LGYVEKPEVKVQEAGKVATQVAVKKKVSLETV